MTAPNRDYFFMRALKPAIRGKLGLIVDQALRDPASAGFHVSADLVDILYADIGCTGDIADRQINVVGDLEQRVGALVADLVVMRQHAKDKPAAARSDRAAIGFHVRAAGILDLVPRGIRLCQHVFDDRGLGVCGAREGDRRKYCQAGQGSFGDGCVHNSSPV